MGVIYRFGDFELDVDRFELRREDEKVEVQPKVLRLLLHLIANRDRAVSSDELLRELWPNTRVEPGSLKRAVLGARSVLGERGSEDSSVRTVRGHGYRFVREVEVIEQAPALGPASPAGTASQPQPLAAAASPRGFFVGRERTLSLVVEDLSEALRGRSSCVLLTGEPGIGKSRIAEAVFERAREVGAETWLGRCSEGEGVPAFWPFVQAFRDAMQQRGAEQFQQLVSRAGPDMARAMNDLQNVFANGGEATPLETHSARFRMFDSVGLFLRRAAEARPIVLGFDDLHLADAAALQLLTFIVRQAYAAPLFIIGTFRREAGPPPPLLAALASTDRTRCIELRGLSRDDLARYLELAIGSAPPDAAVDAVHVQTAGNPLFVRQLVESSSMRPDAVEWDALLRATGGFGLRGAIERHLHVVSEACRAVLRTAAVLGRAFSESLLVEASELPLDEVRGHLSAAEAARLIEPLPERGRFYFTHGLIRDALYQRIPAPDRARLHGRAARALESRLLGLDYVLLAEVTRHFVLAAPAHDDRRALEYTLQAADTALARLAYEEAAEHFKTALQLCSYEEPDPTRRMQLTFRLGEAQWRSAEYETARAIVLDALYMAKDLCDAAYLARASLLLAELPDDSSTDAEKVTALREALAAMDANDPRRACVQASLAKSLAYTDARSERVALAHAALQVAASFDDLRLRSEVMRRCHEALVDPEHLQERVVVAAEILQLAHRQDDPGALLRASAAQIETCIERGDYTAAIESAARMETLAEQEREPFFRWHAQLVRAMQAFLSGQPALAETRARDARAYGLPFLAEGAHHVFAVQMTAVCVVQARMRDAEPIITDIALRYPNLPGWDARVGSLDWTLGRHDQARARLARIMDRGLDWIRREPYALSGLCSVAELCALTRDAEAAKALYPQLAPYASHYGVTALGATTYGPVTFFLALLSACCGELARAQSYFERAYESAVRIQSPTFQALIGSTWGLLLSFMGPDHRDRAIELLEESLAIGRRCELHAVTQQSLDVARLHGFQLGGTAPARNEHRESDRS